MPHTLPSTVSRRSTVARAAAATLLLASSQVRAAPAVELEAEPGWSSAEAQTLGGVAFGDGNGDGHLDLAAGSYANPSAQTPMVTQLFHGDGAALETTPSWTSDEGPHTTALAWAGFDGAELPSLLVINGRSEPMLRYDRSGGQLATSPGWSWAPPAGGGSPRNAAVGDVDGDGRSDLFVSALCYSGCDATPSFGFVSGGAALPGQPSWTSNDVNQWAGIALGDLDASSLAERQHVATGDGAAAAFWLPGAPIAALDRVLVDGQPAGPLSWDAAGYVQLAQAPAAGAEVEFLYRTAGAADLLLSSRPADATQAGGVFVFPNDGAGPATSAAGSPRSPDSRNNSLILADLDRDGLPELVAGGGGTPGLAVFANDGGTLSQEPVWTPTDTGIGPEEIAVADFNGDGFPDVAAIEFGVSMAYVFINHEGELEREPSWTFDGADPFSALTAGDVDGDAMPDLVIGTAGAPLQVHHNLGAPPAAPTIDAVSPTDGGELSITGSGFRAPVRVYVGDVALTGATVDGTDTVRATLPADLPAGRFDVVVVNPDVQAAVLADALEVEDGAPGEPEPPNDAGGCGCAAGGAGQGGGALLLGLATLLLAGARRPRRATLGRR